MNRDLESNGVFLLRCFKHYFEFVGYRAIPLAFLPDDGWGQRLRESEREGNSVKPRGYFWIVISDQGYALADNFVFPVVVDPVSAVLLAPMGLLFALDAYIHK